jgi:P-type E1-E2 ATPase
MGDAVPEGPVPAASRFKFTADELREPDQSQSDELTEETKGDGPIERHLFDWQNRANPTGAIESFGGMEALAAGLGLTSLDVGLTTDQATDPERLAAFGENRQAESSPLTYWQLIWEGLHDLTLLLLLAAAVVSIVMGMIIAPETGWLEGCAILIAVAIVLNVGAINDLQKDKQFRDLNAINNIQTVKVRRDGKMGTVQNGDIVVGEVVILEAGDQVPADGLFIKGSNVKVDESSMTGEPDHVKKSDRRPYLISGTEVMEGSLDMLVVAVGRHSVMGRISELLGGENTVTPLQAKLEKLATQVSKLGMFVACVVILAMSTLHIIDVVDAGRDWEMTDFQAFVTFFMIGVTILVVAIPEGLPLAVTIALAYSVKKMMVDNNLVRHLDACETMGGANTICSDKTGTLTQNKMTVMQAWIADAKASDLLNPMTAVSEAQITREYNEFVERVMGKCKTVVQIVQENCCINSAAEVIVKKGKEELVGSSTEVALLLWARSMGIDIEEVKKRYGKEAVKKHPFSSKRKRSSIVVQLPDGRFRVYVKGASEMILRLCTSEADTCGVAQPLGGAFSFDSEGGVRGCGRKAFIAKDVINTMAGRALRTLALAYRDFDSAEDWGAMVEYKAEDEKGTGPCPVIEDELTLLCVVGIQVRSVLLLLSLIMIAILGSRAP